MAPVLNAMTVDVEDYFQVSAFADRVPPDKWPMFESRVSANTERILDILDTHGVRGTFFVLGWVAERFPALVRRIVANGHEVASHSYDHGLVYDKTPEAFRADLHRARAAIEQAAGVAVEGYRAPSYSLTTRSLWALEILVQEGYAYDASIYPTHHDRYGIPNWERHIHEIRTQVGSLWELPGSTTRYAGVNFPMGGGGYFRLLPYWWTSHGIRSLNLVEGQPAIFYLHPWELDPDQPRLRAGALSTFRHYYNLGATETRLRRLLREFRFGTISEVLASARATSAGPRPPVVLDSRSGNLQMPPIG